VHGVVTCENILENQHCDAMCAVATNINPDTKQKKGDFLNLNLNF